MTLTKKYSKYNVAQQFVEMMLLQNKPWLVRYKKIRAMSYLPRVDCGKFKLKKACQSGKILSCNLKNLKSAPLIRGGVEDTRLEAKAKDTKKNPRPRTVFPKTEPLEAKDSNVRGQGQGPRTQAQAFS